MGKVVALLFYPGDETLVCTKQLCSVRDHWDEYVKTGAEVVGISRDSQNSHLDFGVRHKLPIRLLTDVDRKVTDVYCRPRFMPIWAIRSLVVIDAKGRIRFRKIMLRAFRPSDREVLTAISLAQHDALAES